MMGFGGIGPGSIILILVLLPIALLPTIIALSKNHPHKVPIILVNILGGLLWGIGWLVALVWCFITPNQNNVNQSSHADEIEKLYQLKEKGIISEDEFNQKKGTLLKQ